MRHVIIISFLLFLFPLQTNAFGLIRDAEFEDFLAEVLGNIYRVADINANAPHVYIYNSQELNAFATDEQSIYVSMGLLGLYDHPEPLIGVLCHEVGHIKLAHLSAIKNRLNLARSQYLASLFATGVFGLLTKSGEIAAQTAMASSDYIMSSLMKFSRMQEESADKAGLQYLDKLGISSVGLHEFLEEIMQNEKINAGDPYFTYLRSHPLTRDRLGKIKDLRQMGSHNSINIKDLDHKFKMIAYKARAYLKRPNVYIASLKKESSIYSNYGIALAALLKGDLTTSLQKSANLAQVEPNNPYILELYGQALLRSQKTEEAASKYLEAYKLDPKSLVMKMEYANLLVQLKKDPKTAVSINEEVLIIEPNNPFAWRNLAKAYALNKDNFNSNLALGLEAVYIGDKAQAERFKRLSSAYAKGSTNKKALIRLDELTDAITDMPDVPEREEEN